MTAAGSPGAGPAPVPAGGWWRRGLLLLALGLALPGPRLAAQDRPLRLEVTLADSSGRGSREAVVREHDLLSDQRWTEMLRSGFPLRLHYRLELWRARSGWFDDLQRTVEWDVVVRHEPLLDQYAVSIITPNSSREHRYPSLERLAGALGVVYRIAIAPAAAGEFYYKASLRVSTLSDADLDALERFLRGEPTDTTPQTDLGDVVSRGTARLLLKLGGLPTVTIEGRSATFGIEQKRGKD
jgi:hypothetical protein